MKKEFKDNWQKSAYPSEKQPIVVAVSGGRDSMVLANLLFENGHQFSIAHCNFQLRKGDSDKDEALVLGWAKERNITAHHIKFDTEKSMQEWKMSLQETARKLRYDWFQTLCKEHQYHAIATAHHANDNAETLLINLCKGTGIAGLHGIPSKNNNIIRPLLFATRAIINEYAEQVKVPYREDESNASTKYLRNAVRHKIIPEMEAVFPNLIEQMNDNIRRFADVEILYQQAIATNKKKLLEQRGNDVYLPILKLKKMPAISTLCFEIGADYGFNAAQTNEILKLMDSESGHYTESEHYKIIKDRDFLIITKKEAQKADLILIEKLPQKIKIEDGDFNFTTSEEAFSASISVDTAQIDFDTIELPMTIRRWRIGDYFYPLGMAMKKKKIGRFLIDQKVPIHEKEKLWIVLSNEKIVWVAGMRIDERFKVKTSTKKILKINFSRR